MPKVGPLLNKVALLLNRVVRLSSRILVVRTKLISRYRRRSTARRSCCSTGWYVVPLSSLLLICKLLMRYRSRHGGSAGWSCCSVRRNCCSARWCCRTTGWYESLSSDSWVQELINEYRRWNSRHWSPRRWSPRTGWYVLLPLSPPLSLDFPPSFRVSSKLTEYDQAQQEPTPKAPAYKPAAKARHKQGQE
jgi:hypothetical protein